MRQAQSPFVLNIPPGSRFMIYAKLWPLWLYRPQYHHNSIAISCELVTCLFTTLSLPHDWIRCSSQTATWLAPQRANPGHNACSTTLSSQCENHIHCTCHQTNFPWFTICFNVQEPLPSLAFHRNREHRQINLPRPSITISAIYITLPKRAWAGNLNQAGFTSGFAPGLQAALLAFAICLYFPSLSGVKLWSLLLTSLRGW